MAVSPEVLAVFGVGLSVLAGQAAVWYKIGKLEGKVHLHLTHHQEAAHARGHHVAERGSQ